MKYSHDIGLKNDGRIKRLSSTISKYFITCLLQHKMVVFTFYVIFNGFCAKFDIFNLQYRLPRQVLQVPYDLLNRLNRKSLMKKSNTLVKEVSVSDYFLVDNAEEGFDLFCIAKKA